MTTNDSHAHQRAAVDTLLAELDTSMFLLLAGDGTVHGNEDFLTLVLIGRCLSEEVCGCYLDPRGGHGFEPPTCTEDDVPEQTRRIQDLIRLAQEAGTTFVVCYHVEGDPLWRMAWSGGWDRGRAVDELISFVDSGLALSEIAHVWPW